MNRYLIRPAVRGLVLALAVTALSSYVARAVPYASGISNDANTVYFTLNQDAQGLVVLRDGANPVSPGTTKGVHSFDMTGYTTYSIIVTGDTALAWTQISDDNLTQSKYYSPRGVAIDTNPKRSTFGQIIVAEALGGAVGAGGRTTTDGLYIMNAVQGDIWGQGDTAFAGGIDWTTGGSSSPWKIGLNRNDPSGQDYTIYIGDWSDGHSGIWTADLLNPTTAFNELLDNTGRDGAGVVLENNGAGPGQLHGSVSSGPWVEGTGASRVMFTLDEDVSLGNIWQYDIGTTTSGYATAPTARTTGFDTGYILNSVADIVRAADGSWWAAQYRFDDSDSVPSLLHYADGASAPSWHSGPSTILLSRGYGELDIYEPEHLLVLGCNNGQFFVLGITDPDNPVLLDTVPHTGATLRDVAFDAAGNIYVVSSSSETLRIYSQGGYTEATTSSDGTFNLFRPTEINVSVKANPNTTSMDTSPPGVFTVSRTGSTASTLTVDYTLTGTATNGVHYQTLPTSVTFEVGASSSNLNVVAIPLTPAGPIRTVTLTLNTNENYVPYPPSLTSATVSILDTNFPALWVGPKYPTFYERTNDYGVFTVTRYGDTNTYIAQINMSYGGTATDGTQYYVDYTNIAVTPGMNYGEVTRDVRVEALHDGVVTGPLTVTATVEPSTFVPSEYDLATPPAGSVNAVTRVDSDDPPETILWQDNLQTDTSANWTERFATANGAPYDATVTWAYDYSSLYIPPAPRSAGDTHGLYMTVNNVNAVAAGVNLYPNGQSFSGNYAFRFDMYLNRFTGAGTTQYGLYGINHSGTRTNWFRDSTGGVDPTTWDFDGVFFVVEADGDFYEYLQAMSGPTISPPNPTALATGDPAALAGVFKSPPYVYPGVPANPDSSGTPMWTDVSIEQIDGVIYWYINRSLIFAYTNTTGFNSGNVMLGYCDAWDSLGGPSGAVIFANARVVELPAGLVITDISVVGGNVEITFTANSSDTTADFVLQQSSPSVSGTYADTSSTISSLGGNEFKATKAVPAAQTFYRVRRIP